MNAVDYVHDEFEKRQMESAGQIISLILGKMYNQQ
jgi:hypothetical protein